MTTNNNYVVDWVLFALSLLLAASSSYIARLLFSVFNGFKYKEKSLPWMPVLQKEMLYPVTLLLKLMFIWIAFIITFPYEFFIQNFQKSNLENLLNTIKTTISFLLRVSFFIVLIFTTYRLIRFLRSLTRYLLRAYKVDKNAENLVLEGFSILCLVLVVLVIFLGSAFIFEPYRQLRQSTTQIFSLFYSLNFFTATLLVGFAPVFNDVVAGLTLYSDKIFRVGELIQIPGVCLVGTVEEFHLRSTQIRRIDRSFVHIPNSKFLKWPAINYSKRKRSSFEVSVQLPRILSSKMLRDIEHEVDLALRKTAQSQESPFRPIVYIDDKYTLQIRRGIAAMELSIKHKIQTELILAITEVLEKKRIVCQGDTTIEETFKE